MSLSHLQLSAQILETLNNQEKTLTERFQLASLLFITPSVPVPKKEELVLEWIASTISSHTDSKSKIDGLTAVNRCLSSARLSSSSAEIKPSFMNSLLKALGELSIEDSEVCTSIRQCILTALGSPPLQNYFCRDLDVLSHVSSIFCRCDFPLQESEICLFARQLVDISKLCLLQNELRMIYVGSLFLDLCKAFSSVENPSDECNQALVSTTDEILFRERCLTERFIDCFPSRGSEARSSDALACALVSLIRKLPREAAQSKDPFKSTVMTKTFSSLLLCVLNRNADNHVRAFHTFTLLCHALGIKVKGRVSVEVKAARGEAALVAMAALVKVLEESRISLDLTLGETTTLESWFTGVFTALVNIFASDPSANLLLLLTAIFRFNPLIIENCHQPLRKVMLAHKKEEDILDAYCCLLSTTVLGAEKVGRLHKILGKIAEGLLEELQLRADPGISIEEVFPPGMTNTFSTAVAAMPAAQVLTSIKSLQYYLQYCIKNLSSFCSTEAIFGIEIIVTLLSMFIKGTKITDYSVPVIVKDKFASIVDDINQCLLTFSEIVLDESKDQRVLGSFLILCHAVAAYRLFSWKYDCEQDKLLSSCDLEATNLHYILPCLDLCGWQTVSKAVEQSSSKRIKHLFFDILLQKMEAVAHLEEGLDGPGTLVARYLFEHATADWQWKNALILLPKLEDNELLGFVESLVLSAGREYTRWLSVVSSTVFLHNKRLIIAISIGIFTAVAKHIDKNSKNGAVSHRVMSKVAVVPLLEYELLRIVHSTSAELFICETEIRMFLEEMSGELTKYLLKDPSPALPSEDFCIDGFIDIISKIPYEHCGPRVESCAFLAVLSLLCDIPIGMNSDMMLLDKLNLILGGNGLSSGFDSLHAGAALKFLARRCAKHPAQRDIVSRFARASLCCPSATWSRTCESLVRTVRSPTAATLWQTTAVIRALVQASKIDDIDQEEVRSNVELLGISGVGVLNSESPQVSLISDYTVLLKYAYLAREVPAEDEDDSMRPSPIPQLDSYSRLAMNNFEAGKHLIKLVLKKWSFLGQFIHGDFQRDLWKTCFINSTSDLDTDILVFYFSSLELNDFKDALDSLGELLEKSVKTNGEIDEISAKRCFCIWEGLVTCYAPGANGRVRVAALTPLMASIARILASYSPPQTLVLAALSLLAEIAHQTPIALRSNVVDGMLVAVDSVTEPASDLQAVQAAVAVVYALWRWRRAVMSDRLPALLQRFIALSTAVAKLSPPSASLDHLACTEAVAVRLFKLSQEMVRDDKELNRVAPYIVADLMKMLEYHEIYSEVKIHFTNILHVFFNVCDHRSLTFLSSCLPTSVKELYKTYYAHYKKYQYSGKI